MGPKTKQALYSARHYQKNHAHRLADNRARKQAAKVWLQEYKSTHSCIRCGEPEPCCLDFHHRDPKDKEIEVPIAANRGWSITSLQAEIAKCDVLCANCHRKVHHGLLAHSGERHACTVEAVGAKPTGSTNLPKD